MYQQFESLADQNDKQEKFERHFPSLNATYTKHLPDQAVIIRRIKHVAYMNCFQATAIEWIKPFENSPRTEGILGNIQKTQTFKT